MHNKGRGGGLTLLWKDSDTAMILSYTKHLIYAKITPLDMPKYLFIGIYGHPKVAKIEDTWTLICSLKAANNSIWLISGGDFNEILRHEEK